MALGNFSLGQVVAFAVGIYVIAAIVPGAITTFFDANTTGWSASTVSIWDILPLLAIVALLYLFFPRNSGD